VVLMTRLGSLEYYIELLSGDLMPVVLCEPLITYWASVMTFKPDLKTRETKEVATFSQRTNIEIALTDYT
jgi:hypothetical protein